MSAVITGKPTVLDATQDREFAVWRAMALQKAPYLASLMYQVTPLSLPGLGTMGVDASWRLYIDFEQAAEWGREMCSQVLLHEAMHLIGRHAELARSVGVTGRMQTVWNVAADFACNDDLRDMGCSRLVTVGLLPGKAGLPDYRTATEYYAELVKRLPPSPSGGGSQSGQSGQQGDDPQQGQGSQQGEGSSRGESGQSQGDSKPSPLCGGGSGTGAPTAEWELDPDDDLGGKAPAVSDARKTQVRERVESDMAEHAKSRGTVPAGLLSEVEASRKAPVVPWEKVLMRTVTRYLSIGAPGDQEVDYTRRSRRHHASTVRVNGEERRVFVPSRSNPRPRIVVVRDTSGSMSDLDLDTANTQVMSVIERAGVEGDEVLVADVDAEVAATRTVRAHRDLAEVAGRGGTDMGEGIAWAESLRPRPSAVIVLTDGGTPWPESKGRVPVIACVIGAGMTKEKARHGWSRVPEWIQTVPVDTSALASKRAA